MTCVRVGVIPKALGNSAFELARIGAEEAIAELDDAELIFDGPVRPTIAGQIAAIEDLVARGVDVLALDANDPRKLLPGLRVDAGKREILYQPAHIPGLTFHWLWHRPPPSLYP